MKIRDDHGNVCEDKALAKLLKIFGLYDDSEEGSADDWFFSDEEKATKERIWA